MNQLAVEVSQVHIVGMAQRMSCNVNGEATGRRSKGKRKNAGHRVFRRKSVQDDSSHDRADREKNSADQASIKL
ncbi:MAG: hypothetical protein ACXW36_05785, partial [Nitrospira sp.]